VKTDDGVRFQRAIISSNCYVGIKLPAEMSMTMRGGKPFFGWSVAWAAFALAVFAWGIGFYGPSVFLQTLHTSRGWSISQISAAITLHFLLSALLIMFLPEIHRKLGIAGTSFGGAVLMAVGLVGWSGAWQPWQLFLAAIPSAAGWATTSGAALNAIVAPWFERDRPKALGLAFNGASVGGVLFVPLWVFLIGRLGFPIAAVSVAAVTVSAVALLSARFFSASPASLGLAPDGDGASATVAKPMRRLSRSEIVQMPRFLTLSGAFALGLFAQIGLLSHLIVRLTPDVGVACAGLLVSLATICAVLGRTLAGWWIGDHDRRIAAASNFAIQVIGVLFLIFGSGGVMLTLGCMLFGLGIGNLTSLPPLIAQKEFNREDVVTVVALIVAINQAVFAFAPAIVGVIRDATSDYLLPFSIVACVQLLAGTVVLLGRGATR
jgi:predicted MFS family arabinose efflux permease